MQTELARKYAYIQHIFYVLNEERLLLGLTFWDQYRVGNLETEAIADVPSDEAIAPLEMSLQEMPLQDIARPG